MQLKPLLLDMWLDNYEHGIEFNLAASTGPSWTLNERERRWSQPPRREQLPRRA